MLAFAQPSREHAAPGAIPSSFQRRWPALCQHLPPRIRIRTAPAALGREILRTCALHRYRHRGGLPSTGTNPAAAWERGGKEQGKNMAFLVSVCATLVPINGEGAMRARGSEAPRARHKQEGSWRQQGVLSQVNSLLILFCTVFLAGGNLMTPGRSTLCN